MWTLRTRFGIQCLLIILGTLVLIEIVAYLYFCLVFDEREGRTYLATSVLFEFSSPNDIEVIQLSYNPQFKSTHHTRTNFTINHHHVVGSKEGVFAMRMSLQTINNFI
jgi:hypothetical protein